MKINTTKKNISAFYQSSYASLRSLCILFVSFNNFDLLPHCFTWLVVEETADASLGSVEEGCCHGVILSICTEQLEKGENCKTKKRRRDTERPSLTVLLCPKTQGIRTQRLRLQLQPATRRKKKKKKKLKEPLKIWIGEGVQIIQYVVVALDRLSKVHLTQTFCHWVKSQTILLVIYSSPQPC